MNPVEIFIYILIDPTTNNIRYVGKTNNINKRFYYHINVRRKTYCSNWIYGLKERNLLPIIEVLDIVYEDWEFWEKYWITQLKCWGYNLTNMTDGGDGHPYWKGKKLSREHVNKIAQSNKGKTRKLSDSTKLNMSKAQSGRKLSNITKSKISKSQSTNNSSARVVLNMETGIFYDSITEVAKLLNIKHTTLFAQLSGQNKNKTNYRIV